VSCLVCGWPDLAGPLYSWLSLAVKGLLYLFQKKKEKKKKKKFYMPIFLWDVESSPNYTEKLIFAGIGTITLIQMASLFGTS
jgi:hypothetical protein